MSTHTGLRRYIAAAGIIGIALLTCGSSGIRTNGPAVSPETDKILHETLDQKGVEWGYEYVDSRASAHANWYYDLNAAKNHITHSSIKIYFHSNLPPEQAHFTALHEYGHALEYTVMAAQTPFLNFDQTEAHLRGLFDVSQVLLQYPDLPNPHLEILATCIANILNGGKFSQWSIIYTTDCSGARGTAAQTLLNGQMP